MTSLDRDAAEFMRKIVRGHSDSANQEIHQLARNVHDWNAVLQIAQEHRVTPLLAVKLGELGILLPPEVRERLRTEYEHNTLRCLVNASELIGILSTFKDAEIEAMPFKGVVLGASVYGNMANRPAGDIDVLIRYEQLLRATQILKARGYELKTPVNPDGTPEATDYFEYHFERPADGMVVELRWRLELTQPRFRRNLGMNWVWPNRCETDLAGAKVPDIRPEILLLVLCMHASKHVWSRLIWICDVSRLLEVHAHLNWNEVMREARRTGLWRALELGVLLAHRMTDAFVPNDVLSMFEKDARASRIAAHIEANLFIAPGSKPQGRVPYHLQLLGFQDRLSLLLSLEFLRPNERDRAVIRLPESLRVLYYLVRPYRILRDRTGR